MRTLKIHNIICETDGYRWLTTLTVSALAFQFRPKGSSDAEDVKEVPQGLHEKLDAESDCQIHSCCKIAFGRRGSTCGAFNIACGTTRCLQAIGLDRRLS